MNKKAVCLFSGGLDSVISVKIMMEQGIECIAVNFTSPFFGPKICEDIAHDVGVEFKNIPVDDSFLEMVKKPKHGHGSAINPCIDCKIHLMRLAKNLLPVFGASFIVSGEVLGQRPMSQHREALDMIEREAGVEGLLLRPLSAHHLPATLPEKEGIVDRNNLYSIFGRTRKPQLELAEKYGITNFTTPAGGCLLAEKLYAVKLRDYFCYNENIKIDDVQILKYGRHFRFGKSKIVSGRNDEENKALLSLKKDNELSFSVPNVGSPLTILQGELSKEAVEFAAQITAFYSDCKTETCVVEYSSPLQKIEVKRPEKSFLDKYNIQISAL
jgi:tRNA-uridine 2-sulfurtransferase